MIVVRPNVIEHQTEVKRQVIIKGGIKSEVASSFALLSMTAF